MFCIQTYMLVLLTTYTKKSIFFFMCMYIFYVFTDLLMVRCLLEFCQGGIVYICVIVKLNHTHDNTYWYTFITLKQFNRCEFPDFHYRYYSCTKSDYIIATNEWPVYLSFLCVPIFLSHMKERCTLWRRCSVAFSSL